MNRIGLVAALPGDVRVINSASAPVVCFSEKSSIDAAKEFADAVPFRFTVSRGSHYPKIGCNSMYHSENPAAPALRRLGRAGLEAPPLRGQKILSFFGTLERQFP